MNFRNYIINPLFDSLTNKGDRNSFCIANEYYTYSDLYNYINIIRSNICEIKDDYIGLVINDDIYTYSSILALWFEGKCYVPLHPNQPLDRCLDIIQQVDIHFVLDSTPESRYSDQTVYNPTKLLFKDGFDISIKDYSDEKSAYILFTSGSTGVPKGVVLSRNNISSFIKAFSMTGINLNDKDRCLQCFDLTFDVSVQAFLYPLLFGACVYTIPYTAMKFLASAEVIDKYKITFAEVAPSMIRFLRPYLSDFDSSSIRYCILTAEASDLELVEEWSKFIPDAEIFDFYGPTEATIYCTYYKFNRKGSNKALNGNLSIGKPLYGIEAIILDVDSGILLSQGRKGELCVSGNQITPGYWKNEAKNSEVFVTIDNKKYYKTGDLCYFDEDGDIMYSGRIDFQTKIQGFRVELGEIEFLAHQFLNQKTVAVTYVNKYGNTEIALFVETDKLEDSQLKEFLVSKLPPYMIPSKIQSLTKFPLNSNYKIDRKKLLTYLK